MIPNKIHQSDKGFNKNKNIALNIFWAGFIIYTSCYVFMVTGVVSPKITYLQLLGIILFIPPAIYLIEIKLSNNYLKILYSLNLMWSVYIISRGIQFNKDYLFENLVDANIGILVYAVPIIMLFPKNLIYLKKIIHVIFILGIIYLIGIFLFRGAILNSESDYGNSVLEYFSKYLGIPAGFILLTIVYHKYRNFGELFARAGIFAIIGITLFLSIIEARRGLLFMVLNILFFTYLVYNYYYKSKLFTRFFPIYILIFAGLYFFSISNNQSYGRLSLISERLYEDTRTLVEEYFFMDMGKIDILIGKGIEGQYYCPTGAGMGENDYRKIIETDYLQIILKGGIVHLLLLLLIAIPAISKGLFYSKNMLSKVAGIWILLWVFSLYPATVTTFSLNYILVWVCIGICYSKKIRQLNEAEVRMAFQYKLF